MSSPRHKPIPRFRDSSLLLGSWREFREDRLELLLRVGQECGEIGQFQMGPIPFVLINSASLVSTLMVEKAPYLGTESFGRILYPVLGRTALPGIQGEYHRRIRRIMAPAFQHKRLVSYTENMVAAADALQRRLKDGEQIEVVRTMQTLVRDILVKSLFNIEMSENDAFFESVHIAAEYISSLAANPISLPLSVPTPYNRRVKNAIALLRSRAQQLLVEGKQRNEDKGDFLSMLILARDEDGSGLSDVELLDQILTLYMAGLETTANMMAFSLLLMAERPEIQARVQAEVDSVLGGRPPTYADLARLPYTLQVLKETLRLYPPAFFYARSPLENIELEGYQLTTKHFLVLSPYVTHRNPEYFPDPERFDPERFTPENEKKLPRHAFLPFGIGPHVCIGQHFALMEAHLSVAHLFQHLSVSVMPNQNLRLLPLATLTPSAFHLKVTRRKAAMALAS
jgi:cytochrome P450